MRYTLLVLSPPDVGYSNRHALEFSRALCSAQHEIASVFFYDAGVLTALGATEAAQDEADLRAAWQALAKDHAVPLHACVASAARFGLGTGSESERVLSGFAIAGLGELVDASASSDRFVSFGG